MTGQIHVPPVQVTSVVTGAGVTQKQPPILRLPNFVGPEKGRAQSMLSPAIGLLVADLSAGLEPLPTILRRYQLSKSQFTALLADPTFRAAIKAQREMFHATANLPDRIRFKAQLAVEELLQDMFTIAAGANHPPAARVAAFNQIKNLTGLERPEAPAPKQRFGLTINIAAAAAGASGAIQVINEEVGEAGEEGEGEFLDHADGPLSLSVEEEDTGESTAGLPAPTWQRPGTGSPVAETRVPPKGFERKSLKGGEPVRILSRSSSGASATGRTSSYDDVTPGAG